MVTALARLLADRGHTNEALTVLARLEASPDHAHAARHLTAQLRRTDQGSTQQP